MICRASYPFTKESLTPAFKIHFWQGGLLLMSVRYVFAAFLIVYGLYRFQDDGSFGFVYLVTGVTLLLITLIQKYFSNSQLKKHPIYGLTITVEASETEFTIKGEGVNSAVNWGLVHKVIIADNGALIYQSKRLFNWFPFENAEPKNVREELQFIVERAGVRLKVL